MSWLDRVNAAAGCLPLPLADVPADDYEARRDRRNFRNGWRYDFSESRSDSGKAAAWLNSAADWRRQNERTRVRQSIAGARRINTIHMYEESRT
jgi:hypothetical protein